MLIFRPVGAITSNSQRCVPVDVISMAKRSDGYVLRKHLNEQRPPLRPPSDRGRQA